MYLLINQHIEPLLTLMDQREHLQRYYSLIERLQHVNVAEDAEFQKSYRAFWAMNVARLSEDFIAEYFGYLEQHKYDNPGPTVEAATRHLYEVPTSADGQHTLQFSFASKLVHMIAPTLPIYDRMVERFYFLPEETRTGLNKLPMLLQSYNCLVHEYQRIIEAQLLAEAIVACRVRFPGQNLTDEKIIDSLIWSFVSWCQGGAVRDGAAVYA